MDKKRRSLDDAMALSPEKLAFIGIGKQGNREGGDGNVENEKMLPDSVTMSSTAEPETPSIPKARRGRKPKNPAQASPALEASQAYHDINAYDDISPILVPLTTRLSPATADALRTASLQLRLQRRRLHTQQEIVEAAVRTWLTSNGFLRAA